MAVALQNLVLVLLVLSIPKGECIQCYNCAAFSGAIPNLEMTKNDLENCYYPSRDKTPTSDVFKFSKGHKRVMASIMGEDKVEEMLTSMKGYGEKCEQCITSSMQIATPTGKEKAQTFLIRMCNLVSDGENEEKKESICKKIAHGQYACTCNNEELCNDELEHEFKTLIEPDREEVVEREEIKTEQGGQNEQNHLQCYVCAAIEGRKDTEECLKPNPEKTKISSNFQIPQSYASALENSMGSRGASILKFIEEKSLEEKCAQCVTITGRLKDKKGSPNDKKKIVIRMCYPQTIPIKEKENCKLTNTGEKICSCTENNCNDYEVDIREQGKEMGESDLNYETEKSEL